MASYFHKNPDLELSDPQYAETGPSPYDYRFLLTNRHLPAMAPDKDQATCTKVL